MARLALALGSAVAVVVVVASGGTGTIALSVSQVKRGSTESVSMDKDESYDTSCDFQAMKRAGEGENIAAVSDSPQVLSHPVSVGSPNCFKVHKFQQPHPTSRCKGAVTVGSVGA
jgi:hypothetical protein